MKNFLLAAAVYCGCVTALSAQTATFTVTPRSSVYSPGGGSIIFDVEVDYTGDAGAIGVNVGSVPSNWAFAEAFGQNLPAGVNRGDTGSFGFFYSSIPATPVLFSFAVDYPAGLTGTQIVGGWQSVFRPAGSDLQTNNLADIVFTSSSAVPSITTHPVTTTAYTTQSIALTVAGSGSGLTYQWYQDGAPINATNVSGATTPTLSFTNLTTTNGGTYTVDVTNANGTTSSRSAQLTVTTSTVPAITSQPASQTANLSSTVTLTAAASSVPAPTYQWTKNGANLTGATTATLTLANISGSDVAAYRLVATNFRGSATSNAANLTLNPGIGSFTPATVFPGTVVTISGAGFTGATAVAFNGVAASSFVVVDDFTITAVVPVFATNGAITVTTSAGATLTSSGACTLSSAGPQLVNESTRLDIPAGGDALQSFTVHGTVPQQVLVRAAGPALATFGVTGYMADPQLTVYNGKGEVMGVNDNWDSAITSAFAAAGAFTFATGSKDAALALTLNPGTYTTRISGVGSSAGTVLCETYFLPATSNPDRFGYLSTRLPASATAVGTVGFSIGGNNTSGNTPVLIRAIGAGLGGGALADPKIAVFDSSGRQIAANDDASSTNVSQSDLAAATAAAGAMPLSAKDSAVLLVLSSGGYTVQVMPATGGGGVALVEVFTIDSFLPASYAPALLAPLGNQNPSLGGSISFAAATVGKPAPTFQWQKNGTDLAGKTGSTLTLVNVTSADSGSYGVVLSNSAAVVTSATADVGVAKAAQTITFPAIAAKTYGTDASFTLGATTSSGLPIVYTVSGASNGTVATVSGNIVSIVNAGFITITASQPGNADYLAATNVSQILVVKKGTATINLAGLAATYDGTPKPVTATTVPSGLVVNISYTVSNSPTTTAPSSVGSYPVTATVSDTNYQGTVSDTLVIGKASQTITFDALATVTFGDAPFTLGATASSGLGVTYASSNPAVATVSGSTVTIVGAGTSTVTASQTGNGNFNAATAVTQTLTVNKAGQSISFSALPTKTFGDAPFTLSAAATSGIGVTYSTSNPAVATISGNTVTIVGAGSATITASQPGNGNYSAAADVPQPLTVNKASQTITFGALTAKTYGDPSFTLGATASSGLAVSYASSDSAVATVLGNTVTIVGVGSATLTASQPGNANYNAATDVLQVLTVSKANQAITFAALPAHVYGDGSFTLAATTTSSLPITYSSANLGVATISSNAVTIVGAGTSVITASQAGNANYNAATAGQTLTVNKAPATIALSGTSATYDGAPHGVTATTTPTGLTVAITYAGGTTEPTNAGTYAVSATIQENNYQGTASGSLTIAKAPQTITFGALSAKTYGDPAFTITGASTSGLAVAFASSNPAVATVSGDLVTIVGGGTTTITASQTGDTNYNPAAAVTQTLTVNKAAATVTLGSLLATYDGSPKPVSAITNPGNLPVTFTYAPAGSTNFTSTAPTNAGSYTVIGTIVHANYSGTATDTLVIGQASQAITFGALPTTIAVDSAPFALTATASSGLAVTYTTTGNTPADGTSTVASISGNTVTPGAKGSITVVAHQAGNGNYLPAADVPQVLNIAAQSQTLTFATIPARTFAANDTFTISASSNRNLQVSFASSNASIATIGATNFNATTGITTATVNVVGAGQTDITVSQAGNDNTGQAPSVVRTLVINKATAGITLASLAATYDTTPHAATATTSPTGLNVVFTYTPTGGAATSSPPINAGTYAVNAAISDANYTGSATGSLVIAKASQTITFAALPIKLINAAPFSPGATSDSALPVTYTSSNSAVATVSGSTVTLTGLGNTTITAAQPGDSNYLAATSVQRTLTVNPVAPVIVSMPPPTVNAVLGSNFLYGPITLNALSSPTTFSMTGAPAGLTVNAASGNISGVPTAPSTAGTFTITLTASNVTGSDSKTIMLTLKAPAPVITSAASASGTAGTAFTYTTVATNATSFTATGLPTGITIDGSTGVISGTTTHTGTYTVTLTATNSTGSVTLPLVLTFALPSNAPVYTGTLAPSGTAGTAFSFTPNFGTGTTTFALTGTLPTGLGFSAVTGLISGTPTQVGTFPISIAATRSGITASVDLNLTINPALTAPVITFGTAGNTRSATYNVALSPTITLTATPSTGATFAASGLPAGLNLNSTTGVISGTPTVHGTFTVTVSASTTTVGKGPDATLIISIVANPNAPAINSAAVVTGQVNVALTYNVTASNTPTSYATSGDTIPGMGLDTTTGAFSGTPTAAGTYHVFFTATNASDTGPAVEVVFSIAAAAATPVVNSNGSAAGQVGQPFSYVISATNSPTAFLASPLPGWASLDGSSGLISGIPTEVTSTPLAINLTASNTSGTGLPKVLALTISPAPATPTITSTLTANARVGSSFTYQMTATDSPTSYVATGLPAGLSLASSTGVISGTPTTSGTYTATLRAANSAGLGTPALFTLTIAPATAAPSITSAAAASGKVGTSFAYAIVATPTPISSYALTGTLPLGLNLNTSTGAIAGTPAEAGVFAVQLTATGSGGTSAPLQFVLNIAAADAAPVITSAMVASATVGSSFSYQITAVATPAFPAAPFPAPYTLDAVGLPPGLAVNPSTGLIAGTPTTVGTYTAWLVGSNSAGTGPIRSLVITVQPAAAAPVITSAASVNAQAGAGFSYQIEGTNSPTAFEVLDEPTWMVVNGATGALSGTPSQPGTILVSLVASNATGSSAVVSLTITIAPSASAPVITSTRTASGRLGSAFSYQIVADTTGKPAVSAYVAHGLPAGLALNSTTGTITGTPSVSGTFSIELSAVNSGGSSAPVTLTLLIQPSATLVIPGS